MDRKGTLVLEACNKYFSQKKKLIESCFHSKFFVVSNWRIRKVAHLVHDDCQAAGLLSTRGVTTWQPPTSQPGVVLARFGSQHDPREK